MRRAVLFVLVLIMIGVWVAVVRAGAQTMKESDVDLVIQPNATYHGSTIAGIMKWQIRGDRALMAAQTKQEEIVMHEQAKTIADYAEKIVYLVRWIKRLVITAVVLLIMFVSSVSFVVWCIAKQRYSR